MSDLPKSLIDPASERDLLATIIANPPLAPLALERVRSNHFAEPLHAKIHDAIEKLVAEGKTPDEFAIDACLTGSQLYSSVGGLRFLVELSASAVPYAPEKAIAGLSEAVQRNYLRRQTRNTTSLAKDRAEDPQNTLAGC